MGKKSRKKTGRVSVASLVQNTSSGIRSNSSNAMSHSTPVAATVANAATMEEEETEPIAKFDMDVWETRFPFAEKTLDPRAQELDKAQELFLQGIQLAKTGDLSLGGEYIASAYLRDPDVLIIRQGDERGDERTVGLDTLKSMMTRDSNSESTSLSVIVLSLILALLEQANQSSYAFAMKHLNCILETFTEEMLETSTLGRLGGLTMAKGYYLRGRLFQKMGNGRSALKDWGKAIKLDPSFVLARLQRLRLWAVADMKTHPEIHAECVLFLGLVHDDYSELDVIYALLALATFVDFRLGTYAEAMEYYRKSLQATSRRVEVHGPRFVPHEITRFVRWSIKFAYEDPNGEFSKKRKSFDDVMAPPRRVGQWLDQKNHGKVKRNCCLNCHKNEAHDGIQLGKCSRCKQVYYCSKECTHANWKEHKVFCNEISGHSRQTKAAAESATAP